MQVTVMKNLILALINVFEDKYKYPWHGQAAAVHYLFDTFQELHGIGEAIHPNDLGAIYRRLASILNDEADNLRDESHTTIVER